MGSGSLFFFSYNREMGDGQAWNALMSIGMVAQNLLGISLAAPPGWGGNSGGGVGIAQDQQLLSPAQGRACFPL